MAAEPGDAETTSVMLFQSGTMGYPRYRIPALLVTKKGTLLAFCEGRKDGRGLTGNIDIVLRRSNDSGKTWQDLELVADAGSDTLGNPCAVVDRTTGTIWLLLTVSPGEKTEEQIIAGKGTEGTRVLVTSSTDDGQTWAPTRDITDQVKLPEWTWYGTGPGAALQLADGRLLIPSYHAEEKSGIYRSHSLYSDDHGKTWHIGKPLSDHTSEPAALQRSDGSIYFSARTVVGKEARTVADSADGGQTLTNVRFDETLYDPHCQASLLALAARAGQPNAGKESGAEAQRGGNPIWLYCHPAGPQRRNLTLRVSRDEGKSWPVSKLLVAGDSQYSSLAELPDGNIGCLYEIWGDKNYQILFMRVPRSMVP